MFRFLLVVGFIFLAIDIIPRIAGVVRNRPWALKAVTVIGIAMVVLGVVAWQTNTDWANVANWIGVRNANQAGALATILGGLIALVGLVLVFCQLRATERSLRQAARASLDVVRTEHNWKLFEHEADPGLPGLPSMVGNKEYWKWRLVHLDHLNLLHTQWLDYNSGAIGDDEIEGWKSWAKLILEELQGDRKNAIDKLREHDKTLTGEPTARQLMEFWETSWRLKAPFHISELHNWDLFPRGFVRWLLCECNFRELVLREKL